MSVDDLRVTLAMRQEDLRLAREHMREAGLRVGTAENVRAYKRACNWVRQLEEDERAVRAALIQANSKEVTT